MKDLKKLQAFYFLISAVASLTMYVHANFASTSRVESLETQISTLHNVLCSMAIEQKLARTEEICTNKRQ